jgi:hypothetical protein
MTSQATPITPSAVKFHMQLAGLNMAKICLRISKVEFPETHIDSKGTTQTSNPLTRGS